MGYAACKAAFRTLVVVVLALDASGARADLWAYVDEHGQSHVANRQIDARYKLFFKGETTLDVPNDDRAQATAALQGTPLHQRAMDERFVHRFEPLIETHARTNGLDPALVKAVVAVESGFNPFALSAKGAVGLMQVVPDTGARYGLAANAKQSVAQQLLDPGTNVRIGTRYLRDLLARFANDLSLALAAYNAGEGNVERHDNSIPPFAETRDFVRHVQQVYALYRPVAVAPTRPVRLVRSRSGMSDKRAAAAASP